MRAELAWRELGDSVATSMVRHGVRQAWADTWLHDWRAEVEKVVSGDTSPAEGAMSLLRLLNLSRELFAARKGG